MEVDERQRGRALQEPKGERAARNFVRDRGSPIGGRADEGIRGADILNGDIRGEGPRNGGTEYMIHRDTRDGSLEVYLARNE